MLYVYNFKLQFLFKISYLIPFQRVSIVSAFSDIHFYMKERPRNINEKYTVLTHVAPHTCKNLVVVKLGIAHLE